MSILVYLAGAMEHADDGKRWRNKATAILAENNIKTWNPYVEEKKELKLNVLDFLCTHDKEIDYKKINSFMKKLVTWDLSVIDKEADMVLVKYDGSVIRGAGTHAEISLAAYKNKPVHAWVSGISLRDIPFWALGCFTTISDTLEDAIMKVKENYETSNRTNP